MENQKKSSNAMKIVYVIVCLVVGAGGFFGGVYYQKNKTPNRPGIARNGNFPAGAGQNGQAKGIQNEGSRPVSGEITAVDSNNITVKDMDGSSRIVIVNDSTSYSESVNSTKDKLEVGTKIMATGTENSDKSVTAKIIQINPVNNFNQPPK